MQSKLLIFSIKIGNFSKKSKYAKSFYSRLSYCLHLPEFKKRDKNEKNKEINETIANLTSRVKESSDEYQRYCEKYEKLKVRLDDYENTATNDEPLIKLKKACADLKVEIKNMDVRIGVLNHIVLKMAHNKKKEIIESALNRGGYNKMADAIIIENPDMEEDLDEHN